MHIYIYIHIWAFDFDFIVFCNTINHTHEPADYLFFFAVHSPVFAGSFCHTGDGDGGKPIFVLSITQYMFCIRF